MPDQQSQPLLRFSAALDTDGARAEYIGPGGQALCTVKRVDKEGKTFYEIEGITGQYPYAHLEFSSGLVRQTGRRNSRSMKRWRKLRS